LGGGPGNRMGISQQKTSRWRLKADMRRTDIPNAFISFSRLSGFHCLRARAHDKPTPPPCFATCSATRIRSSSMTPDPRASRARARPR
jgi:hypothetical protein